MCNAYGEIIDKINTEFLLINKKQPVNAATSTGSKV